MPRDKPMERNERVEELLQELQGLQASWKDILERYTLNIRSRFAEVATAVAGPATEGETHVPLSKKRLDFMLLEVRTVKLKPDKGRGKDLARIEKALDDLLAAHGEQT